MRSREGGAEYSGVMSKASVGGDELEGAVCDDGLGRTLTNSTKRQDSCIQLRQLVAEEAEKRNRAKKLRRKLRFLKLRQLVAKEGAKKRKSTRHSQKKAVLKKSVLLGTTFFNDRREESELARHTILRLSKKDTDKKLKKILKKRRRSPELLVDAPRSCLHWLVSGRRRRALGR